MRATTSHPAPAVADPTPARRRDLLTVLLWLTVIIGGALAGGAVFNRLSSATDPAPASESQQARHRLEAATGERDSIVAVITDTAPEKVAALAGRLRQLPGIHSVRSSVDGQLPLAAGGGTLLAVGVHAGLDGQQVNATVDAVRTELGSLPSGHVLLGGYPVLDRDLGTAARADLARAEAIALPIVLILLGFAVRSALGPLLGLGLVATTVTGALVVLWSLSAVTEVSAFAVNVVTMFGIGLAVDYTLLVVARFRRERATATVADAVTVTMATSGRTVALSGLTVAVALAGLLVFAEPVVRSMAYGGIGAVAVAVASTLTLLPVLLRRLGHHLPPTGTQQPTGGFARLARLVQRRPTSVAAASLGLLALLALPLGSLALQGVDARSLPAGSATRHDADQLAHQLPRLAGAPITVVAEVSPTDPRLPDYLARLRRIDHVTAAAARPDVPGQLTVIDVAVDGPAGAQDAIAAVDHIRALHPDFGTAVTGLSARFTDSSTA